MKYDPERHHRRSFRLKGYDYTQAGAYFVTIVTQDRACLFGEVVDGQMRLNAYGDLVCATRLDLPNHYPHAASDVFLVMPNHLHGIIVLNDAIGFVGAGFKPAPTVAQPAPTIPEPATTLPKPHGLPEIVRALKAFSARRINERRGTPGVAVWQRDYYERVIRNDESLNRIRQYILDNPAQWVLLAI